MKKFIAGVVVGALVTSATAVIAAGPEQIAAYLRPEFSVSLNGSKAELTNSPAIINDSMYLPLKEVADLVGVQVQWNQDTLTAELRADGSGIIDAVSIVEDGFLPGSSDPNLIVNGARYLPLIDGAKMHGISKSDILYDPDARTHGFKGFPNSIKIESIDAPDAEGFVKDGVSYIREDLFPKP